MALKVILSFDGVLKHAFKTRWAVTNDGEGLVSEVVKLNQMLKFPNNHQIKCSLYTIYSLQMLISLSLKCFIIRLVVQVNCRGVDEHRTNITIRRALKSAD